MSAYFPRSSGVSRRGKNYHQYRNHAYENGGGTYYGRSYYCNSSQGPSLQSTYYQSSSFQNDYQAASPQYSYNSSWNRGKRFWTKGGARKPPTGHWRQTASRQRTAFFMKNKGDEESEDDEDNCESNESESTATTTTGGTVSRIWSQKSSKCGTPIQQGPEGRGKSPCAPFLGAPPPPKSYADPDTTVDVRNSPSASCSYKSKGNAGKVGGSSELCSGLNFLELFKQQEGGWSSQKESELGSFYRLPQQPIFQRLKGLSLNPAPNSVPSAGYHGSFDGGMVPAGLPVEKWFGTKFCCPMSAYRIFAEEFEWLNSRPEMPASMSPQFLKPKKNTRTIQAKEFTVNAHYVEGLYGKLYIACEGPNQSSTYDFWEMVWQEKVGGILMLNQPYEERLYPKSYNAAHETVQYWPLKKGESKIYAPWKVTCIWTKLIGAVDMGKSVVAEDSEDYVYRLSKILLAESNPITNPEPREILHICYYRWPDGQIPSPYTKESGNYQMTYKILMDILLKELKSVKTPLVVHCHAGVGRTGVAIALDIAARRLLDKKFADVRETVRKIREQRPRAVMNVWQYVYINVGVAQLALEEGLLPKYMEVQGQGKKKEGAKGGGRFRKTCASLVAECWQDLVDDFRQCCCKENFSELED